MATWKIDSIIVQTQVAGYTNVVYRVYWTATATDGTNTAGQSGMTELSPPTGTFTPYADLTEAQVMGWVHDVLGTEGTSAIEQGLNEQLVYMQAPVLVALPLPWAG